MTTEFSVFNLLPELEQAITALGYVEPTPIQAGMIPLMLTGADVIGQAQTGTGEMLLGRQFSVETGYLTNAALKLDAWRLSCSPN